MTPEEARALPRPKGECAGWWYMTDERKPHTSHRLVTLPIAKYKPRTGYGYRGQDEYETRWNEKYEEWKDVRVGRVCNTCWAVYDPTPVCIWRDPRRCEHPSKFHEMGDTESRGWGEKPVLGMHYYCGKHAPSQVAARLAVKAERRRVENEARDARLAPYEERDDAETDLLEEVRRWRDDEDSTEGFCGEDKCEHHECRLARAVARLERAEEALDGKVVIRRNRR